MDSTFMLILFILSGTDILLTFYIFELSKKADRYDPTQEKGLLASLIITNLGVSPTIYLFSQFVIYIWLYTCFFIGEMYSKHMIYIFWFMCGAYMIVYFNHYHNVLFYYEEIEIKKLKESHIIKQIEFDDGRV